MVLPLPPSASLTALSTPELHAAVLPISSGPTLFKNWATTFQSLSTSTFNAKTVEDVRMVVELARREGKGLRMKGSGHSPSDLVCTDGYLLGINGLSHLLAVRSPLLPISHC
jgi:L-gulonolactone oxidase